MKFIISINSYQMPVKSQVGWMSFWNRFLCLCTSCVPSKTSLSLCHLYSSTFLCSPLLTWQPGFFRCTEFYQAHGFQPVLFFPLRVPWCVLQFLTWCETFIPNIDMSWDFFLPPFFRVFNFLWHDCVFNKSSTSKMKGFTACWWLFTSRYT